jgi:hypothetical protein
VAKLKYLGITVTSVYIREEITSRLNWENTCYHSLSPTKNVKVKIYKK